MALKKIRSILLPLFILFISSFSAAADPIKIYHRELPLSATWIISAAWIFTLVFIVWRIAGLWIQKES